MIERGRDVLATLAWSSLAVSMAYLALWGVARGLATSFDLLVGYAAGQAWLQGRDPYDLAVLQGVLAASGVGPDVGNQVDTLRNVYFPTTLPLFVPLGWLEWPIARALVVALNTAASVAIALGLCRILGWRAREPHAVGLVAFVLALAPLHTSMAIGQSAILATCLIVLALLLERRGRPVAAGIAYGLATVAKVQLGLPFLVYQVLRRRFATGAAAGLVLASLTAISILRMQATGVPWLSSWLANLGKLSGPGGINDSSPLNPERYSLVNLQYLLGSIGVTASWADILTFGIVGLGAVALLRRGDPEGLIAPAIIAPLTLIVIYHRYYDAVVLALPIAWAFSAWRTGQRLLATLVLALCADFLVPAQTALNFIENRQILPAALTDSFLWRSVLMTQHVWALLLIASVLLWAMVTASRRRHDPGNPALEEVAAG